MKKMNKLMIAGLAVTLLASPIMTNNSYARVQEQKYELASVKHALTSQQVVKLAANWAKTANYVQGGGNYKEGEYKSFQYKGKTYRYLARNIDTKKELLTLLKKTLTSKEAEKFIKTSGIIVHKGKLAQIEADGGSLLDWSKASATYVKTSKNTLHYRLVVPVGDTDEKEIYLVGLQKVGRDYRISNIPTLDHSFTLTNEKVEKLVADWITTKMYVQSGGSYKEGEYQSFYYQNTYYRYLASDIDTMNELLTLLKQSLTQSEAEKFIKDNKIIVHNGKLAQPDADGGSLLLWKKTKAEFVKENNNTKFYRVVVPVGDLGVKSAYIVEIQKVGADWKISKPPYLDLDIPGNINPAYLFIYNLLINSDISKDQLLNVNLNVDEFKKGINKLRYIDMKEVGRETAQVEFAVKFYVELKKDYKGSLKPGENQMFFLIQQTDEMEYKIVSVGTEPHLKK
ncbi:DL-endopeptidase inhibitor IseA family protein [Bacillus sp. 31A1R]|uniref:DL-endopeptidase inhibitor IseA family protein n=1 Tax=Robertmurraya mangrovi TaxID=3098077 RepID=A0ABU5J2D7_9BACI|nr:DL-endopeptidase inhibitor IseA family protein [Bacillus sp. 31A1R]MDZ5473579.1 DL-endopeptidase inhibitor IseA family protein [Bacillus sp. 31A1R]